MALVVAAPAAHAAPTPGIQIGVLHSGAVVEDGATIPEGDSVLLRIAYDATQGIDGKEVTITLPSNLTAPSVPAGNDAVESVVDNGDGTVTIKFFDPIPATAGQQGALAINLTLGHVDENTEAPISWTIGDDQGSFKIVIEHKETPPTTVTERWTKAVNPTNLNGYFEFELEDGEYRFTGLKDEILNRELTYTLRVDSPEARTGYSIADQLPAGLGYVTGSFAGTLRTYNPQADAPFAFSPTVTGNAFAGTVDVPANSSLFITYKVVVTDKAALEAQIEAVFAERGYGGGWAQITATNTATYGGTVTRPANVQIGDNVPGVGVGQAFAKDGSWTQREVDAAEDGTLNPPAEMTYTLKADLTKWTGESNNFTLTRNVVISDQLIPQASWKAGDDEFITATGITLTKAADCPSAADFAADEYVGQWCVNGQTLLVNVGKDNTTNASIQVKAQLNTVADLADGPGTTIIGGDSKLWPNTAQFTYRDGSPYEDNHDANVVVLPTDRDGGLNDSSVFTKTGPESDVRVNLGESAEVPYQFRIDTSRESIDPLNSRIVDEIDETIFDISDPSAIAVTGSYGSQALGAEHFSLTVNEDNNLVIELSEAGKALVGSLPEDQLWTVDIVLTTFPLDEATKETLEIHNRAVLLGSDGTPLYWDDDDAEATSYGDEAEVRKRVYDAASGEWTDGVQARIEDGQFIDQTFYYRIEFIPRGSFGNAFPVQIFTVNDVLPDAVDFVGFVTADENEAPIPEPVTAGPVDLHGNVVASYADGVVSVSQKPGTNLNPNDGPISVYFAVDATDASDTIVNKIGNTSATIDPIGDPSVDIEKWNDEGSAPEYDETGALTNDGFDGDFDDAPGKALRAGAPLPINFTISNDGREDLVDVEVSDELTDGKGQIEDLSCVFPDESTGTTWAGPFLIGTQFDCTGTLPALEGGDTHSDTARVTGTGIATGEVVDDEDDWNGEVPVPSVDIEKWNDEGSAPEYDETGKLTNDGFDGDFDAAPGKQLQAGAPLPINFTVSNDGVEDLVDVAVSDELTDGKGQIEDLSCVFPDGSTGTEWAGPFAVGTQFDCTGTLPALEGGDVHSDTARVIGTGISSGIDVDDEDGWNGEVPVPSVDIEKWSDEGSAPEYDESGKLTNDGFDGDFDKAPGKELKADKEQKIHFTISNDGHEPLVSIAVSDELTSGKGKIKDLVCVFPDGSTGTEWAGPLAVGAQFECTGTLPALLAGDKHADTAKVTAVGLHSGIGSEDADDWHGSVPEEGATPLTPGTSPTGGLSVTGGNAPTLAIIAAILLLLAGGGAVLYSRRKTSVE